MKKIILMILFLIIPLFGQLSGSGTEGDPYLIGTYADFLLTAEDSLANDYCKLTADIDISSASFIGAAGLHEFKIAQLDGDGYKIHNLNYENLSFGFSETYIGAFTSTNSLVLKDLTFENITYNIYGTWYSIGYVLTYNIALFPYNQSIIKMNDVTFKNIDFNITYDTGTRTTNKDLNNVYSAIVTSTNSNVLYYDNISIDSCSITLAVNSDNLRIGALAGNAGNTDKYGNIAINNIEVRIDSPVTDGYIGGLIGYGQSPADDTCNYIYVTGKIVENSGYGGYTGGVYGRATTFTRNSDLWSKGAWYSAVDLDSTYADRLGGFAGYLPAAVAPERWRIYFDSTLAGTSTIASVNGSGYDGYIIPKSTVEMKTEATYDTAAWDFTNIWGIDATINTGYPYLLSMPLPATAAAEYLQLRGIAPRAFRRLR